MNNNEQQRKKCTRCKVNLTLDKFKKKRDDTYQKQCIECNKKVVDWNNSYKCEHGKQRSVCITCDGKGLCKHGKSKSKCKDCEGASMCPCGKHKIACKKCGGNDFCKHGRRFNFCRECDGKMFCVHDRVRSTCKECDGASICSHGKVRTKCVACEGGYTCLHKKRKDQCLVCSPELYLAKIVRERVRQSMKTNKSKRSIEYLGCTIECFKVHIEKQFKDGMSWDNFGDWQIDHITPLMYNKPTIEQVAERLHWTNTQPLWAKENMSKGNRRVG